MRRRQARSDPISACNDQKAGTYLSLSDADAGALVQAGILGLGGEMIVSGSAAINRPCASVAVVSLDFS